MKFSIVLLTASALQVSAHTYGQNVTLKKSNATLVDVFKEIRKQTGYDFIYSDRMMENAGRVNLNIWNLPVEEALRKSFVNQPFVYAIENKTIIVKALPEMKRALQQHLLSGRVINEKGEPLDGVTVRAKNSRTVSKTGKDGVYSIQIKADNDQLLFNYMGYEPQVAKVPTKVSDILNIQLKVLESKIEEVIVTGTGIERKKESFTGATTTFTAKDLKMVGNNNLINSLRSLDPSFLVLDNDRLGSNPNTPPKIELRGKTTVDELTLKDQFGTDPNQPLFILDGFESTLQTIIDLDMNRVASVTILKDAASTALYGSKAANGVIVVETVKPVPGKLQFSYSTDLRFEGPDLSVYNMMNAREKLEFERLSGRYIIDEPVQQLVLDSLYNRNLSAVARGVDTYWLTEPVRNIVSQNHSMNVSGGDQVFRYGVNFNYKTNPGVMKGSKRDTWGGNINLIYRKSKMNINNSFTVGGVTSSESPYGNFQDFVNANPYYEKGIDNPYLDNTKTFSTFITTTDLSIVNPLYNASLPFKNESGGMNINNNLSVQYEFTPKFRFNMGLGLSKGYDGTDVFTSPDHTTQASFAPILRGKYSSAKRENFSYTTNALLSYGNVINKVHSITANIRGQISHNYSTSKTFVAQGFPTDSEPILAFAYGYEENKYPKGTTSSFRSVNATGSVNYAYDMRYLFDASYRLDGSTAFGKSDPWSPYWSTGIGWNVNREAFLKGNKIFTRLKLFSNLGVTGNQAMNMPVSTSVYQYLKGYNQAGLGINILELGNPDLMPSKTTQLSSGLEFGLFENRVSGYLNTFNKTTNNQVIAVAYPTSSGVDAFKYNAGKLITRGYELKLNVTLVNDRARGVLWRVGVTGATGDSEYRDFGPALEKLNASRIPVEVDPKDPTKRPTVNMNSLRRFEDGVSPNDLFTARSLGIDPATGREMFITKTGEYTTDYSEADMPKVGSTKPFLEGVISNNFTYKGFSLSVMMRYKTGGDIFNEALLKKVENIGYKEIVNNQDKRALYERWREPGDIKQFKNISLTDRTEMSSRFMQEENLISLESVSLNYIFSNKKWMKSIGLENLNLSAYTNDIVRFSTVKRERGTSYPFARSVSFSLRASF